jgi:hypothetical protein
MILVSSEYKTILLSLLIIIDGKSLIYIKIIRDPKLIFEEFYTEFFPCRKIIISCDILIPISNVRLGAGPTTLPRKKTRCKELSD